MALAVFASKIIGLGKPERKFLLKLTPTIHDRVVSFLR
jgi:hypothetical protein